ncbi:hypothetical protein RQP46_011492 [Phenoliferia psychrophenolica]
MDATPGVQIDQQLDANPYHNPADRVVYIDADTDERITWGEYLAFAKGLASGIRSDLFQHAGLSYGDLVLILSPNMPHYPMTYIGLMGAGLCPSPVSPAATAPELAAILRLAQAKAAVVHPALQSLLSDAVKLVGSDAPDLTLILMDPEEGNLLTSVAEMVEYGSTRLQPFEPLRRPAKDSLALVPYSSGTTGPFKGVMLSHRNIIANVIQLRQGWADYWEPRPMSLSFLADYHSYSHTQVCIVNPISGMPTVRMPKYNLVRMLESIQKYRVVAIPMVPPVAVSLAKDPITANYDLSSLKRIMIAAAPTKDEVVARKYHRLRMLFLSIMRGGTDLLGSCCPACKVCEPSRRSQHSPEAPRECRLLKEDGTYAGFDEEGEFLFRGGYYRNPGATRDSFDEDGWFRSGDVGKCNCDGLFWVTDRIKEMIKVNGYQVSPAELEAVLLSHPLVLDAAVKRGIAERTELPVAFVSVAPVNQTPAIKEEIKLYVKTKVAHYKRIATVVFMDEIPKNPSGKILRRLLPTLELSSSGDEVPKVELITIQAKL